MCTADMGRLHHKCNRLRLRLCDNVMITITIMITSFSNVIDYDYDYISCNHDCNRDYFALS